MYLKQYEVDTEKCESLNPLCLDVLLISSSSGRLYMMQAWLQTAPIFSSPTEPRTKP